MAALMKRLRQTPPAEIAGVTVAVRKDYADGNAVDCATGAVTPPSASPTPRSKAPTCFTSIDISNLLDACSDKP